jgi:hypothetical protein
MRKSVAAILSRRRAQSCEVDFNPRLGAKDMLRKSPVSCRFGGLSETHQPRARIAITGDDGDHISIADHGSATVVSLGLEQFRAEME